jgi:predicted dehydrogenase
MEIAKNNKKFLLKKILRYIRIYGPRLTYVKIMGKLHLNKKFSKLPIKRYDLSNKQSVGIIGCGFFSFTNIAYYLNSYYGNVIGGCMDINADRAASLSKHYNIPLHTDNVEEILKNKSVKLVYIASNHASHAEYAIEALRNGKHVYIEKPHVISEDQLDRLVQTIKISGRKAFLGFNRPRSRFASIMQDFMGRESGPAVFNWFVVGHELGADHWYLKEEEGGRVLGNMCHWTDFLLRLVPSKPFPIKIIPAVGNDENDMVVSLIFGDGSIGVITFTAKSYAFEGVVERFAAQKGKCLITMDNFDNMTIDVIEKKYRYKNFCRELGHKNNIIHAYNNVINNLSYNDEEWLHYIWNTGLLFLKVKEALVNKQEVTLQSFQELNA